MAMKTLAKVLDWEERWLDFERSGEFSLGNWIVFEDELASSFSNPMVC